MPPTFPAAHNTANTAASRCESACVSAKGFSYPPPVQTGLRWQASIALAIEPFKPNPIVNLHKTRVVITHSRCGNHALLSSSRGEGKMASSSTSRRIATPGKDKDLTRSRQRVLNYL